MNILCLLDGLAVDVARIYSLVLLIYAVLSWFPDARRFQVYLAPFVEPVLAPLRRIIPPMGGLDLSFLALILVLNYIIVPLLRTAAFNACYSL